MRETRTDFDGELRVQEHILCRQVAMNNVLCTNEMIRKNHWKRKRERRIQGDGVRGKEKQRERAIVKYIQS